MSRKPAPRGPILDAATGLRQRQRADGLWRLWWEPTPAMAKAGARSVDFDPAKPAHATREARSLHAKWTKTLKGGAAPVSATGRSVTDLILSYRNWSKFRAMPATTRASYIVNLRAIEAKWGPQPVILFDKPTMMAWYEALLPVKGPTRARALLRMASILFGYGELLGWREGGSNPVAGVPMQTPQERERVATRPEVAAILAAARARRDRDVLMGIYLSLLAGQRQFDALDATPAAFAPVTVPGLARPVWVWTLTQRKRARVLRLPIAPEAVPLLRTLLRRAAALGHATLLVNAHGAAFTKERFFARWEKTRALAAQSCPSVTTLQWRDLRRSFANFARAGGATVDDVSDVIGNSAARNSYLRAVYMAPQLTTTLRAIGAASDHPERKKA